MYMRGSGGFGLIHLFIFLAVFIFFLLTVSFLVHSVGLDDKNSPIVNSEVAGRNAENADSSSSSIEIDYDYKSIEKQLKKAASLYQKDLYPDFNDKNDVMYVTSEKLIALDYLTNLTDGRVSCSGYAKFTYDNVVKVTPYIICGDSYETKGYSADVVK